ncbi:MFS transporter [bacterium]|nr:MFS transporter [bacterium]
MTETTKKLSWNFPKIFWSTNVLQLVERAAYYGSFITMSLYLTRSVGFTDIETGWVVGLYAAFFYLMPLFLGAIADKIGFRISLILAFLLLTVGYGLLGSFQIKATVLLSLLIILLGGAMVKVIFKGTAAKCSDAEHRSRAFSILYMAVNIGSFSGKMIAKPLRIHMGLEYINFYAASMALIGLIFAIFFFKNTEILRDTHKSIKEVLEGLWRVVKNFRFMIFVIIIGGFWAIQGQMYATMPKYILRLIGESASPEWLANVNPLVVVLCVIPITHLVRRLKPINSMSIALFMMPFSALAIAFASVLESKFGTSIHILGQIAMHPITLMMIIGIGLQGFSECFLSPRYYEFFSKQAPKGETGLYMGFSDLKIFFAWLFGFAISGYLLEAYCPNPKTVDSANMVTAYANAHYIWYIFAGIGFAAFLALLIFKFVTDRIDRKHHMPIAAGSKDDPEPFIEKE